ncbi:MAG TPA: hypothetical protein VMS45_08405 [Gemmatimonadaceae bacterium]|nr:hypothetical protein [Gemmatimonadaceae bacterium]
MANRVHNGLPRWHRTTIYALTGVLFVSGVAWIVACYALAPPGDPTPAPHWLAGPLLSAHGIAAYATIGTYALVGHAHLRTGWRIPVLRSAGIALAATIVLLALTGIGFYYVASEDAVPLLRWTHAAAGALLPCWLALHIVRGRRVTRRG